MKLTQAIDNVRRMANEPMFGGQPERVTALLEALKRIDDPKLFGAVLRWKERFWLAHPDRSVHMDLSDADRAELCAIFVQLYEALR